MSAYGDLSRPPLNQRALAAALVQPDGRLWSSLEVVAQTGSTNVDLAQAARAGAAHGSVLVAEEQQAGKGRLGRQWTSPPRAGLAVSILLRPGAETAAAPVSTLPVSPTRWAWLPLLAGVAMVEVIQRMGAVPALLKWPNDVLVGEPLAKCGGILAEVVDGAVIIGAGLNVSLTANELQRADATSPTSESLTSTSLALAGSACVDRDPMLRAYLRTFARWYDEWRAVEGDPVASGLHQVYTENCATIGAVVQVTLPGDIVLVGTAVDVDHDGRLKVTTRAGEQVAVAAGDVVHVRPG